MRVAISYILLLSLVVNTFFASGYVIEYYMRIDAYLEACMNKDRPELKCDGKCILAKKIAAAQSTSAEKPEMVAPTCFEYVFYSFKTDFSRSFFFTNSEYGWISFYSFELSDMPLIPPQV